MVMGAWGLKKTMHNVPEGLLNLVLHVRPRIIPGDCFGYQVQVRQGARLGVYS